MPLPRPAPSRPVPSHRRGRCSPPPTHTPPAPRRRGSLPFNFVSDGKFFLKFFIQYLKKKTPNNPPSSLPPAAAFFSRLAPLEFPSRGWENWGGPPSAAFTHGGDRGGAPAGRVYPSSPSPSALLRGPFCVGRRWLPLLLSLLPRDRGGGRRCPVLPAGSQHRWVPELRQHQAEAAPLSPSLLASRSAIPPPSPPPFFFVE